MCVCECWAKKEGKEEVIVVIYYFRHVAGMVNILLGALRIRGAFLIGDCIIKSYASVM